MDQLKEQRRAAYRVLAMCVSVFRGETISLGCSSKAQLAVGGGEENALHITAGWERDRVKPGGESE